MRERCIIPIVFVPTRRWSRVIAHATISISQSTTTSTSSMPPLPQPAIPPPHLRHPPRARAPSAVLPKLQQTSQEAQNGAKDGERSSQEAQGCAEGEARVPLARQVLLAASFFVGSSVLAGGTVATPKAPPATVVHPPSTGAGVASTNQATAVPVSVKRTALSTSTSTATLSSHAAEETNEHEHDVDVDVNDQTEPEGPESANEEDGEPITCGKLTRAVVDEVEGLKRRSASGTSMSKLVIRSASTNVKAAAGVAVPLPTSCSSSESLPTSTGIAKPSSTRAFLDVPQHTRGVPCA
ncbi:hypothetical protein DFP72DRAFT_160666 [Ephemerocybe angulata]|uniref:Uncharacterized protein n=1 Tax=Ephemerocybe angulata TaxID=980116 RepID=A0A8H6M8G0_9AGAR|nr:hypothetical protein DFP72DRAFT_160666 [Tulosesus angulatus]